jgi:hypothetical protein
MQQLRRYHTCRYSRFSEVRAARLAVKVAWERGVIAYVNASDSWDREARTFALTASAYPELDLSLTRDQAVSALVTPYFHRYGPATIRDAAWWSWAVGNRRHHRAAPRPAAARHRGDTVEHPALPHVRRPGSRCRQP